MIAEDFYSIFRRKIQYFAFKSSCFNSLKNHNINYVVRSFKYLLFWNSVNTLGVKNILIRMNNIAMPFQFIFKSQTNIFFYNFNLKSFKDQT